MEDQEAQVYMRRSHLRDLPEIELPEGYSLRHLEPGDVEAWAELLQRNGELGEWSVDRASPYFLSTSPMPLDGAFFVLHRDIPVGTAQLHLHSNDEYAPTPELGWVAISPEHQGRGLAFPVCLAVLRFAARQGHKAIFLKTETFRIPAIKMYQRLGFVPWNRNAQDDASWELIDRRLISED